MKPLRALQSWKLLACFWGIVLLTIAGGAWALVWLGPPPSSAPSSAPPGVPKPTVAPTPTPTPTPPQPAPVARYPKSEPQPATLARRNRVAVIVAGIGLNQADSLYAARELPDGATLAFSPYASNPDPILEVARTRKLAYLAMLAVEPASFPATDAGIQALSPSAPEDENLQRMQWMTSRITGYAGVVSTGTEARALRLITLADLLARALPPDAKLVPLFHVSTGKLTRTWSRQVDLLLDATSAGADLGARLDELSRLAAAENGAVGLAIIPRQDTVARIVAWAAGLRDKGLILTPASTLAFAPDSPVVDP